MQGTFRKETVKILGVRKDYAARILAHSLIIFFGISFAVLLFSSSAPCAQTRLVLNYNFNGMVHTGEAGNPDGADGFRSISDRALIMDGSPTAFRSMTAATSGLGYTIIGSAGMLDIIHIGNRNTVDFGLRQFDAAPDGDDIGIQPNWLPDPDQTTVNSPVSPGVPMTDTSRIGILYNISNGGGDFDVTMEFSDTSSVTVTLNGPDWFGPFGGEPAPPGPGVFSQANLPGTFKGGRFDTGIQDEDLLVTEAVITAPELLTDLGFDVNGRVLTNIRFDNRSNTNGGYAVYAVTVDDQLTSTVPAPTVNGWGMIIFTVLAGIGATFCLLRQRRIET